MTEPSTPPPSGTKTFRDLALSEPLLKALDSVGYEAPSPIQAATIPPLLEGRDVLGQAQTGTGKTAAFALPILSRLEMKRTAPQALVLAPTRELAIQVAEAFQRYAAHMPGFHVLPIYGGQAYGPQLAGLRRGVHVVVGTPGRVIDHLERGSLDLSTLRFLVLDEADEMLRMGFIDDVEKILQKTPPERQVALFSATMPAPIRRIAQKHLKSPVEITIKTATSTVTNTRQRYWMVSGLHKLDGLTRILEAEPFDAMIVFTRTKQATEELAERLQARGFSAAPINGDIAQPVRERTIARLKDGQLDILVATDVAARGLDVERISHVLNYDVPYDTESYVHRIGRTGRAGRAGEAILFITPREKGLLYAIERATRQPVAQMQLPSVEQVNDQRIAKFKQRISEALAGSDLGPFRALVETYEREHNVPAVEIAAALARLVQGDAPLLLTAPSKPPRATEFERERPTRGERPARGQERSGSHKPHPRSRGPSFEHGSASRERAHDDARPARPREDRPPGERVVRTPFAADAPPRKPRSDKPEAGKETFRVEVGHLHGVKPGNIVGAVANEAGLDSKHIGRIEIYDDHSLIDLPSGMPDDVMQHLKTVWVAGQRLRISLAGDGDGDTGPGAGEAPARKPFKPSSKPPFKPGAKSFKSDKKPFKSNKPRGPR